MAIIFVCGVVVFLISCIAACSLANYEMLRRQKSAKVPSAAVPFTILMVVFASTVAAIVRLFWFSSIETFQMNFVLAFWGACTSVAVVCIMHYSIQKENSKYLVKRVSTSGTTTTVGRYVSLDSAFSKASQTIKESQCSAIIVEDLSGNELAVINDSAHAKHQQDK